MDFSLIYRFYVIGKIFLKKLYAMVKKNDIHVSGRNVTPKITITREMIIITRLLGFKSLEHFRFPA